MVNIFSDFSRENPADLMVVRAEQKYSPLPLNSLTDSPAG